MNEISIIINGVRYDAVDINEKAWCRDCDLLDLCNKYDDEASSICFKIFGNENIIFKKNKIKIEP